jgi:hypothetical protein
MRDVISDPTAGQRARDVRDRPDGVRRRLDPTDPRYRRARVDSGQAAPSPDPTDPTYGAEAEPGRRTEMRVLVRRTGRGVGASLPLVIAGRPMGHVHGLARGEGSAEHLRVAGSPVGQVIGGRPDERRWARRTARGYVLRLRGLRSA